MSLRQAFLDRRFSRINDAGLDFPGALADIDWRLRNERPFALTRFGDGELNILQGRATDLSHKGHGEHRYVPGDESAERQRGLLRDALCWRDPAYIVALPCPCCVGLARHREIVVASGQPVEQLTWATVFVNSNYAKCRTTVLRALAERPCNLICHRNARVEGLPFRPRRVFSIGANAWLSDYDRVLEELVDTVQRERISNECFLFSAGVLSNLLIRPLTERFPGNTWIDLGSVLDPELGLGDTRKYHRGGRKAHRVCRWG